jgi:hypothetical protein
MALLPGSPAIDAGDNTDAPDWDQRGEGFPRIVGVIDPDNPVIDIGAYEVQGGGNGPGRSSRLGFKPVRFEAAALVGTQSLLPVSHSASEAKPTSAARVPEQVERLDRFFAAAPVEPHSRVLPRLRHGELSLTDDNLWMPFPLF